ncbi:MAG: hypothetical protein ACYC61_13910 [Isosphaeraceae bacterium]
MAKKVGRPKIDLREKIADVLSNTEPLGPASRNPITHYREAVNANLRLINYIEGHLSDTSHYPARKAKHMGHLRRLVLANLIETFERFIKELAAVCIDQLSSYVTDDRYNTFTSKGNEIIAHFEAASIGKALCESDTWLSNEDINKRFRKLLAPFDKETWEEYLFPGKNQGHGETIKDQRNRAATLSILWQVRHNLTHNSGVLTGSDSMKLKVLTGRSIEKDRKLVPTEVDLRYVKQFLSETADQVNRRVGTQLGVLLTAIYSEFSTLVDPPAKAQELANIFALPIKVATTQAYPVQTA